MQKSTRRRRREDGGRLAEQLSRSGYLGNDDHLLSRSWTQTEIRWSGPVTRICRKIDQGYTFLKHRKNSVSQLIVR